MKLPISTKRLTLAVMMGTVCMVMQAIVPGLPLGVAGAKLEFADIPAVLGASLTGPIGGLIVGFFYGLLSPANLALVPGMMCSFALLGFLTDKYKSCLQTIISVIATRLGFGILLLTDFMKAIYFQTSTYEQLMILCIVYAAPGAIVSLALYCSLQKLIPGLISYLKDQKG